MNFLMRTTTGVSAERVSIPESQADTSHRSTSGSALETLISDDPYTRYSTIEECDVENDEVGVENGSISGSNSKNDSPFVAKHSDVSEEEGWISIPYGM